MPRNEKPSLIPTCRANDPLPLIRFHAHGRHAITASCSTLSSGNRFMEGSWGIQRAEVEKTCSQEVELLKTE